MKTEVLNVPIDVISNNEALEKSLEILYGDCRENKIIVTPNPEMVMRAQEDQEFMHILKNADFTIPDGIGVVLASKFNEVKLKERVAGCDLVLSILKNTQKIITVYIFGTKTNIANNAKKNIENTYKNVKVIGVHSGYFSADDETKIINEINNLKPDLLLVGLGFPKQEKWIYNNKNNLDVKLSMAIGGTIDVIGGEVKRAPKIFIKFGLEWFYRLICQPVRIFRMKVLPLFIIKVIGNKFKVYKNDQLVRRK